jgi:hypothetical protein
MNDEVREAFAIFKKIPHWQKVLTINWHFTVALCRRTAKTPLYEHGIGRMAEDCNPWGEWWMFTLPWTRLTITRWYT